MRFIWENYVIDSAGLSWTVKKKAGNEKVQWVIVGYHKTLMEAALDLFNERLMNDTVDCVVNATEAAQIDLKRAHTIKRIEQIKDEIIEVVGKNGSN